MEIWQLDARAIEEALEQKIVENEGMCLEFIESGLTIQRFLSEDVIQVLVNAKIRIALRRAMSPQLFQFCRISQYDEYAPVIEETSHVQEARQYETSLFSGDEIIPRRTEESIVPEGGSEPVTPSQKVSEEKIEPSQVSLGNAGSIPEVEPFSYPVAEPVRRARSPRIKNDCGHVVVDMPEVSMDSENRLTAVVPDFETISKRIWYDLWEMDCEHYVKDVSMHIIVLLIAMLVACIGGF
jgi:hypothetical protein